MGRGGSSTPRWATAPKQCSAWASLSPCNGVPNGRPPAMSRRRCRRISPRRRRRRHARDPIPGLHYGDRSLFTYPPSLATLLPVSDTLVVNEIYLSLQGESTFAV